MLIETMPKGLVQKKKYNSDTWHVYMPACNRGYASTKMFHRQKKNHANGQVGICEDLYGQMCGIVAIVRHWKAGSNKLMKFNQRELRGSGNSTEYDVNIPA